MACANAAPTPVGPMGTRAAGRRRGQTSQIARPTMAMMASRAGPLMSVERFMRSVRFTGAGRRA